MATAAGGDLAERGGARHWRGRGPRWVVVNRRRGEARRAGAGHRFGWALGFRLALKR